MHVQSESVPSCLHSSKTHLIIEGASIRVTLRVLHSACPIVESQILAALENFVAPQYCLLISLVDATGVSSRPRELYPLDLARRGPDETGPLPRTPDVANAKEFRECQAIPPIAVKFQFRNPTESTVSLRQESWPTHDPEDRKNTAVA